MDTRLHFDILPQPDNSTCGPTCLHAVYQYFGDIVPLDQVVSEVCSLPEGGTLAVWLGCHALRRGYDATIYTYNLQMFDPTWFQPRVANMADRLLAQAKAKDHPKLSVATEAYREFFELGGEVYLEDLTTSLMRRYLKRGVPILTGLSATFLYRCAREFGQEMDFDDVRGVPTGHFVVLCGYDKETRDVLVADPNRENPLTDRYQYLINIDRVVGSILLGVLTYDANLLVIEPRKDAKSISHVDSYRR